MSKIELTDSIPVMMAKMADGNPGAISAMVEMAKYGKKIDPQSFAQKLVPCCLLIC